MAGDGQGGSSGGGNEKGSGANGRRKVGKEKENVLIRGRVAGKWVGNGDGRGEGRRENGRDASTGCRGSGEPNGIGIARGEWRCGRHDGENTSNFFFFKKHKEVVW